jgi:hypothetical protein
MFWFHLKWFIRGKWFRAKQHLYCRFFHRRHLCWPEVWDRGLKGPWHCAKCVPCGTAIDYVLELLDVQKKEDKS